MVGPLRLHGDVLDERAAEGDVQDLDPAAHAEDRQAAVERALGELELERVANRLGRRQVLGRILAVPARVDVAVDARKGEADPAGEGDRALEADPGVVAEVVQAEREPDHRFAPVAHHWTFLSQSS
jgi:hypothetical protein